MECRVEIVELRTMGKGMKREAIQYLAEWYFTLLRVIFKIKSLIHLFSKLNYKFYFLN
jgi:hypothetical protein